MALLAWAVRPDSALQRSPRITRVTAVCLAILAADTLLLLVQRSHVLSGLPYGQLWPVLPDVLHQTHFGRVWLVRGAAVVAAAALWPALGRMPVRGRAAVTLALLIVVAFTRSATGHSADQGDWTVPEAADWLHVLSGIVWAGAVTAAAWLWRSPSVPGGSEFARMAQGLSQLATAGLAGVAITGSYIAWLRLDSLDALWTTAYGRHLGWKLALVGLMAALGAANRFLHLRRLTSDAAAAAASSFRRNLYLEAVVAVAVFIAAAILINTQPPHAGMPAMGGMAM